jgi:hypothetical protein
MEMGNSTDETRTTEGRAYRTAPTRSVHFQGHMLLPLKIGELLLESEGNIIR